MKTFRREYSQNASRDFLSRGALLLSLALLAGSQFAIALMFWRAYRLGIYPFGAPSGVNGVGHWSGDVFQSLLGKSALAVMLGASFSLAALLRDGNERRAAALLILSFVCALILFGILLVMFCD